MPEGRNFEVHPDNHRAVRLFIAASSQWRFSHGMPLGLDYAGMAVCARALGFRLARQLMGQIQVMEAAALEKMAEMRK